MKTQRTQSNPPRSFRRIVLSASIASLVAAVATPPRAEAQFISLTGSTTYTQSFDTLGTATIPWLDNSTLPGWYAGINANASPDGNLQVSNGSADLSGLLNLGATGAVDRALGSKVTGTGNFANIAFGVLFKNDSTSTLDITNISYVGELWRGNSVAGTVENWTTFTKISSTVFTDVEPGANSATANVGTFTALPALNWASPTNTVGALDGNLAANRTALSTDPNLLLAPGQFFMFRWVDTNAANSDGFQGIDNFSMSVARVAENLVFNASHTVGGAPNGVIESGGGNYWLKGGSPAALTVEDNVFFTQAVTSTLSVPANIVLGNITVNAASGAYTFTGAGAMTGALIKSGASSAILSNPNTFSSVIFNGGLIQATVPQTISGTLAAGFDGTLALANLQTDADVTAAGLIGSELLVKTGNASLILTGAATSTATGGVRVTQGSLRTATAAALGPQNIRIDGAGAALVFTHATGDQTLSAATTITPGAGGATITVESATPGAGVIVGSADRFLGANTIIKNGPGILRMAANQTTFSGNWIINGGAVQYGNGLASAMGSGTVTINAGGELAGQNTTVPIASITLSGGALGTRTGNLTNYTGAVNVTANSEARLRSVSTPTGANGFAIGGVLSGAGDLTLTGNLPLTDSAGVASLRLLNPANTFTGAFHVTQFQTLSSEPAAGTGSTLNARPVSLSGGRLRVLDNGTANNGTLNYANNVMVDSGVASLDVNRQTAGTFTGNTVQFGTLTIAAGGTLTSTGGNGYRAQFGGAATVTGSGNVTFQPTTAPLVLAGGLGGGNFGVIKNGAGVFALVGDSAYTGNTAINEGTFGTNGQLPGTPRIDIKTGATLDVSLVSGGFNIGAGRTLAGTGTVVGALNVTNGGALEAGDASGAGLLTTGAVTFGSVAGDLASVRTSAGAVSGSVLVLGTNTLVANGGANSVTVNVVGTQPALGTHVLIDYDGAIGGTGFSAFKLGSLPPRTTASLVDITGDAIALSVTAIDLPIWKGALSSEWSTATLASPKNWALNSNPATGTDFLTNDRVLFNDLATAAADVQVAINGADVFPQEVVFNNQTKAYTLSGSNGIGGTIGITKNGDNSASSTLTISANNTFTGPVTINAGTVKVATVTDAGTSGPLGAGSTLIFDGGALEFTGLTGSTNRAVSTLTNGATFKTDAGNSLTLAGVVSGAGGFTKSGAGTVTLTGLNTYTGVTTIADGFLNVGSAETAGARGPLGNSLAANPGSIVFAGGALQYSAANAADYSGRFSAAAAQPVIVDTNGATVTWASALTSAGGTLNKLGAGQLVLSGATANTFSGVTTVNGGSLTLSKTSGIDAIGGSLVVNAGGVVAYGTTAGQLQDHIPDSATISINGGTFGSGAGNTDAAPTTGVSDVVGSVTISSGKFITGRGATVAPATRPTPFVIATGLEMSGGTLLVSRGGGLTAQSAEIIAPAVVNLDGGSGTADNQSRFTVGAGGLSLNGGVINFNAGPSTVTAASVGSVINLNGDITSAGTSTLARLNPTLSTAVVDLGAAVRTFTVAGTLTIAPSVGAAATDLTTAGIIKNGPGKLALEGPQSYASFTQNGGRTDFSAAIGTGASTVTANAGDVNFGASQTLAALVIGDGAVVTLGSPLPPAPAEGLAFESDFAPAAAAVPEPGSAALLLGGIATLLGLRTRGGRPH